MSARFGAQRRRAFLTYLSQTGNQTLAAEQSGVSRSWVCLQRARDAAFDAACVAAIAEAKASLARLAESGGAGNRPQHKQWRYFAGVELVVRGTGGAGGGKRVQIARARAGQWGARAEARFLTALAAVCNVTAACAEAGLSKSSAYAHRKRWPGFDERWETAVENGYVRVETELFAAGENPFSDPEVVPDGPIRDMTASDALHLLRLHHSAVRGGGRRPGRSAREANEEEVAAALERRLVSFDAWLARREAG